jgi:DNA-binding transcriptional regulator YiaG
MRETKRDAFVYEGLGFPIKLTNVPMRKILGEWAIDIDFNSFQAGVLRMLAKKPSPLTGPEIRFIADYLELSARDFAKLFGVTHTAVLKWEREEVKMNPCTELHLRMHILNHLKVADKEFRKVYSELNVDKLVKRDREPLEVNLHEIAC